MWVHSAQKVNPDHHSRLDDHKKRPLGWLYQDNWWQCGNHCHSFSHIFPILLGWIPVFWVHVQQKTHPKWPIIPFSDTPNSGRFHYIPMFFLIRSYYISLYQLFSQRQNQTSDKITSFADHFARLPSEFGSVHCSHHGVQVNPAAPVTNEVVINW